MSLTLYYGSGSPYAWRAQLALEHKALPYELKILSFSAGDTRKPEFLALNPRHQVPVLVDGDLVLYESSAIAEYLQDAYPAQGRPLFPTHVKRRALARRMVLEADNYVSEATSPIWRNAFYKKEGERDHTQIAQAKEALAAELALMAGAMQGDFLAGTLSAADYALYTTLALVRRCEIRIPDLGFQSMLPASIAAWMQRIEALAYFERCYPPHWKKV
jgi:glutathione S-transferase